MSKKGQRYFSVEDKKSRDGVPDVSEKQKETVQTGVKSKKKPPIMEVIMVDNSKTLPARKRPDFSVKKIRDKRKLQRLEIPLNPAALKRHSRGEPLNLNSVKTDYRKIREKRKDIQIEFAEEQAARAEILLDGEEGFLEADEGESTTDISQKEIVDNVDITTATKHFTLALDFGPYRMRYTKNGTHLLLGGRRGHLAAFSWIRKKLQFEMNVMESVHDVTWLMNYTMFAAAQKEWVHVYDKKGTELHCIKSMHRSQRLEYLPYHFLLCSASESGFLSWMDVSIGQTVATYNCRVGKLSVMTHNPWNGVTCVADSKGVVSMWSPTVRDPLAKMLCHPVPLTALAIDPQGMHMATAALDRKIKIWDIRQLEGPLETYHINTAASDVNLSQRGLMALSLGNVCEIYRRNPSADQVELKPYIRHRTNGMISNLRFCPYEDVLGVATQKGFTSLIVPGSGEPNFDTFEANPFQSRTQRREEEVHSLLEKIPAEFISLNPNQISEVDVPSAKARLEEKVKQLTMKPPKINFEPRNRKGITKAKRIKIKQNVRETRFREAAKEILETKEKLLKEEKHTLKESPDFIPLETKTVLDRFQTKKKKKTRQ